MYVSPKLERNEPGQLPTGRIVGVGPKIWHADLLDQLWEEHQAFQSQKLETDEAYQKETEALKNRIQALESHNIEQNRFIKGACPGRIFRFPSNCEVGIPVDMVKS